MNYDSKLAAIERTVARAIRYACRSYCNKKPDVIVVAHRLPLKKGGGGGGGAPNNGGDEDTDDDNDDSHPDVKGNDLQGEQKRYRRHASRPKAVALAR